MLGVIQANKVAACRKVCNVKLSIHPWERRCAEPVCHISSAVLSATAAAMDLTVKRSTITQGVCRHAVLHEPRRSILQLYPFSSADSADGKPS